MIVLLNQTKYFAIKKCPKNKLFCISHEVLFNLLYICATMQNTIVGKKNGHTDNIKKDNYLTGSRAHRAVALGG